jgi:chemotaxis family two-component system sensor kinase Cph1
LLTYSRVGRRDVAVASVDLETVLDRVQASLRVSIEESEATIARDPLPTVDGDVTQLTQLFQNLLVNAIKFRAESAPDIRVSAERKDGAWLFSVRDNGIGIAPEYRERVFVLFQRLHARDEYGGTGIGLAVCKKIVERHGGTIWVEETPGGGSTLCFTIPDAGGDTP